MSKATTAKRERDGWRVVQDRAGAFLIENGRDTCDVYETTSGGGVNVYATGCTLTPARAAQFAANVAAIAARAAKEAKDGR